MYERNFKLAINIDNYLGEFIDEYVEFTEDHDDRVYKYDFLDKYNTCINRAYNNDYEKNEQWDDLLRKCQVNGKLKYRNNLTLKGNKNINKGVFMNIKIKQNIYDDDKNW